MKNTNRKARRRRSAALVRKAMREAARTGIPFSTVDFVLEVGDDTVIGTIPISR
jgi:hypothetical protein